MDSPYLYESSAVLEPASDIIFYSSNNKTILIIHTKTGTLEKGEAFNDKDKASREVFDDLAKTFPEWKEALKKQ